MTGADGVPGHLTEAQRRVYSASPEDFVQVRSELARGARDAGDKALARAIGALRKPTSAAAIVNRQILTDPSVTDRLSDVGDRLRAAQSAEDGIDRDLLRDLSLERRALVRDVSEHALAAFGTSSGPAVRDEVVATFDAAVADPDVAERLGHLTRAEQWSGFGAVAEAPVLTVVPARAERGRAAAPRSGRRPQERPEQRRPEKRPEKRAQSRLAGAEQVLSAAQAGLDEADERVGSTRTRVEELVGQLDELQRQLAAARKDARTAVTAQRSARSRHREAQSARDRAARRRDA